MSGPFGSSQWMYSSASGFYPHTIDQSLRFEDGDTAYLSRTPSSAGNLKTWTWSAWVKRTAITRTGNQTLFSQWEFPGNYQHRIVIGPSDELTFMLYDGGANSHRGSKTPAMKFRDASSWYHIVCVFDTSNSTAEDRMRVYVNGERITSFSSNAGAAGQSSSINPSLNRDGYVNRTQLHTIGTFYDPDYGAAFDLLDGYMAEVNFIDGTALTADSFGETKDGIWVPKDVSGLTFGTNGFHLDFADSSAIGNDVSGEDNDFAVSGLAATDVILDSPTNGFPTANPLAKSSMVTLSEGNLKVAGNSASNSGNVTVSPVVTSGKWYFEYLVAKNDGDTNYPQVQAYRSGLDEHRPFINGGTGTGGQVADFFSLAFGLTNGDILGIAVDADGGTVKFYDNNSYISGKDIDISAYDSTGIWIGIGEYNTGFGYLNFGQDSSFAGNKTAQGNGAAHEDFFYTPPTGYKGLNLGNFDEPAIISGEDYFNSVVYTGNGTAIGSGGISVTGVNFSPNFVWIKSRTNAYDNMLFDSVRGPLKILKSNSAAAEITSNTENLVSFNSDGFTYGSELSGNEINDSHVAWNWKAGTSVSGNTTGSGTAKAYSGSVNTEAGFSIITYKGNGTAGHTIPHNLGAKQSMVLFKNRDVGDQWAVYHKDILATHNLCLNNTDGTADQDNRFNDTEPTSSVMTLGTGHVVNANDEDYIAYFFTDIDQYCKAGVYSGNSSSDGTYVHTGFAVSWLMVKSTSSETQWMIYDNKRLGYNVDNNALTADDTATEKTDNDVDLLSNGFKWRRSSPNFNQSSYIYLAFAEQPFKYSNAR